MDVLSLLQDDEDVIDICAHTIQNSIGKHIDVSKTIKKIYNQIDIFIRGQNVDGRWVKNISWSIFEFKISIPQTNHLLRIIFHWQRDKIVLLTGSLIKPDDYDDKHTTVMTDTKYQQEIQKAQWVVDDYYGPQRLNYVPILPDSY